MFSFSLEKFKSWYLPFGIFFTIVLWLLSGISQTENTVSTQESKKINAQPLISVRVRDQKAKNINRNLTINGRTAPSRIVTIKAETDGRVMKIGAKRGEKISMGSLLVQLSERDRFANLAESEAIVKQREVEFLGQKKLANDNLVSEIKLQEAVSNLEKAKTQLIRASLDIDFMNIKSPFEGSLQDRYVEIGDFVKSGDNIATIIDDKTLIVKAEISENDVKFLKVGDLGLAKLSTGQEIQGIIRYIAPAAQESTRTFNIELKLKNDKGALRAGVSTQLIISAEEVTAHLVSPALLSLNDEGIIGIKIIEEKNKVKFIPADIVLASDEGVYIAGLPFTSTIITVGQGYVKSGMRVNLISESDTEATLAAQREKQGQ
jgi:multidrug efflux system membrane fusion protein